MKNKVSKKLQLKSFYYSQKQNCNQMQIILYQRLTLKHESFLIKIILQIYLCSLPKLKINHFNNLIVQNKRDKILVHNQNLNILNIIMIKEINSRAIMKSKSKMLKKKEPMIIQKKKYDLPRDIETKFKQGFVVMSEDQFEYMNQKRLTTPRLCCQRFFVLGTVIQQAQSKTYQYKMYQYPFTKECNDILLKTIVSFLNSEGGFIFIGIKETNKKKRIVTGLSICQAQKQLIIKDIRGIANNIKPSVIVQKKVQTLFVPLKDKQDGNFIPGRYIIKIQVLQGNPKELYHSFNSDGCVFHHRYNNECIQINKDQKQKEIQRRKKVSCHILQIHTCSDPQIGTPIYYSENPKSSVFNSDQLKKESSLVHSMVFKLPKVHDLNKIREILKKKKAHFQITLLDCKPAGNALVRLQLSKQIADLNEVVQCCGGIVYTVENGKIISSQKQFDQSQSSELIAHTDTHIIQGWETQNFSAQGILVQKNKELQKPECILQHPASNSSLQNQKIKPAAIKCQKQQKLIPIVPFQKKQPNEAISNIFKSCDFISSLYTACFPNINTFQY